MVPFMIKISNDIIGIIVILFTIYLVHKNTILSKSITRRYLFTSVLVLVVLCLEIITVFFNHWTGTSMGFPLAIANALGFFMSPVVAISMAILYDEELYRYRYKLAIPIYIQALLCISSIWNGWVFKVSESNEYSRGPLFFANVLICVYSFSVMIYANNRSSKEYDKDEAIFLRFLYLLILFGNIVQIIVPDILLIWICVALSMLLYYIFLRELQFKFDPLTGIRNRFSFQKKMDEMQGFDKVGIVVLDLNNLKDINDTLGHLEGDKYIIDSADIIKKSFKDIGITYRIGGDEFCVLCNQATETRLETAFTMLESLTEELNPDKLTKKSIAFGYEIYEKKEGNTIYESFAKADRAMYTHKMFMKKEFNQSEDINII